MSEPQPFTDGELAQARNAPLGWTARRWLATVDALRAALAAQPEPLFEGTMADFIRRFDSLDCQPPMMLDRIMVYPAVAGSATHPPETTMSESLRHRVNRWLQRPVVGGETLELIRELRDLLETIDPNPESATPTTEEGD